MNIRQSQRLPESVLFLNRFRKLFLSQTLASPQFVAETTIRTKGDKCEVIYGVHSEKRNPLLMSVCTLFVTLNVLMACIKSVCEVLSDPAVFFLALTEPSVLLVPLAGPLVL